MCAATTSLWPQADLDGSLEDHGLLPVVHLDAFYGNPADAPARATCFANRQFNVPSAAVHELPPFVAGTQGQAVWQQLSGAHEGMPHPRSGCVTWSYAARPPTRGETDKWLRGESSLTRPPSMGSPLAKAHDAC